MTDRNTPPTRERLHEAATRGVITESEMRRRAESVSQAALIVRHNEERAKKQMITRSLIAGVVLIVLFVIWKVRG
ncbi:MAG: hypothetical protein H6698_01905 [Myxococcales bacterium]|nr:hypothetical protein [Myxococcales bacterium]